MLKVIKKMRTSILCVNNEKILGFWGEDPYSKKKMFFLPGGKFKENESLLDCARREFREETGYQAEILPESEMISEYEFIWAEDTYKCKTHYFIAHIKFNNKKSDIENCSYHRGIDWVNINQIDENFSYSEQILNDVKKMLARL